MKTKKYESLLKALNRLEDCKSAVDALREPQIAFKAKARVNLTLTLKRDLNALKREILRLV